MIESLVLYNSSIGRKVLLDKQTSLYVLDEADLGTIEATHQTSKYPEQIGYTNTSSTLGAREISITGWVIGQTGENIKMLKQVLNAVINPLQMVDLLYDGYRLRFKPKNTIKYSTNYQENNEVLCKFLISGKCFSPLFEDEQPTKLEIATNVSAFHFPLVIPDEGIALSYRTPSLITTVTNNGTSSTGFKIIFEASGSVTNPKITNMNTGEFIKLNKTLKTGEHVEICTEDGNESVIGINGDVRLNYFMYFDLESDWLQLQLGDNTIVYGAEVNVDALSVTLEYNNKYLEVQ